jgi:hypothetical protein
MVRATPFDLGFSGSHILCKVLLVEYYELHKEVFHRRVWTSSERDCGGGQELRGDKIRLLQCSLSPFHHSTITSMPPTVCTLGMFIVDTFAVLDESGTPIPGREIPPQARVQVLLVESAW